MRLFGQGLTILFLFVAYLPSGLSEDCAATVGAASAASAASDSALERAEYQHFHSSSLIQTRRVDEIIPFKEIQARSLFSQARRRVARNTYYAAGPILIIGSIAGCWALELALTRGARDNAHDAERHHARTRSGARVLRALNFLRYLMVWHVVLDSFSLVGARSSLPGLPANVFARWGSLVAVPGFLMLSGFCQSYSQLAGASRAAPVCLLDVVFERITPWYPLYFIGLTACALRHRTTSAEDWSHYTAGIFLIDGLLWEPPQFPFLRGGEWLSFYVVYILLCYPVHQVLTSSSESSANAMYNTIGVAVTVFCVPCSLLEWYVGDIPIMRMLTLWPTFVAGQALACWFVGNCTTSPRGSGDVRVSRAVKGPDELNLLVRFGATIGFGVLGIVFCTLSPYDRVMLTGKSIRPVLLKGALVPILGITILGLSCEVDPIAKLLARAPLRWADRLAFATFVLQVPVHDFVRDLTGKGGLSGTFVLCLIASSVLLHAGVERPWRRFLDAREK